MMQNERVWTVLIADDHPIFRQGLRALLEQDSRLRVIAEAESGESALTQLRYLKPDIALLDLAMPGLDGLSVLEQARARHPDLLICIVTSYKDTAYLQRAMELGARGYVLKDDAGEYLARCLGDMLAGRTFISAAFGSKEPRLPPKPDESVALLQELTNGELRVLHLVAQFLTSKEIADRLHVSYRTVQNHRANITRKLDLKGIHQLAQFAAQHQETIAALLGD